jgi:FtsH-binding integral membrane protein
MAILLAFVLGGIGAFFGLMFWDSFVMHDHDGQAGIGFFILALWVGIACSVVVGILAGRYFWRKYSSPEK